MTLSPHNDNLEVRRESRLEESDDDTLYVLMQLRPWEGLLKQGDQIVSLSHENGSIGCLFVFDDEDKATDAALSGKLQVLHVRRDT